MTDSIQLTDEQADRALDRLARMVAAARALRGTAGTEITAMRVIREGEGIHIEVNGERVMSTTRGALLEDWNG